VRKSARAPKKGKLLDLFHELVHLPVLINDWNFSLEVMLIEEEELSCNDGGEVGGEKGKV
jgi:hypothetical protein